MKAMHEYYVEACVVYGRAVWKVQQVVLSTGAGRTVCRCDSSADARGIQAALERVEDAS